MYWRYGAVVLWMAIILLFSSQDAVNSSQQSRAIVEAVENIFVSASRELLTFLVRKSAHIFLYFVLGLLVYNAFRGTLRPQAKAVIGSLVVAFGYAIADEMYQLSVDGRSGEMRDVAIDTVAAAVGIGGFAVLDKRRV